MTDGQTPNLGYVMQTFYKERLQYQKNLYFQFGDTLRGSVCNETNSQHFVEKPNEGACCAGELEVKIDEHKVVQ